MAALNFPSSPTDGDIYSANSSSWKYIAATTSWKPIAFMTVDQGGTGVATISGYIKGNGNAPFSGATTIPLSDIASINTSSFIGRISASTGSIEVLTGSQATTLLDTASASSRGVLSSTDWTTFNGKQPALGFTPVNPNTSQVANSVYAAPNGAAGAPGFRVLVATDIPTLNQTTTGSAATLTTGRTIAMTGDVTWTSGSFNGSANVTGVGTIANNAVTLAKFQQIATATFLGRTSASTGNVEALTSANAAAMIDAATTSLQGAMSAADKLKLNGIATGATANVGTTVKYSTDIGNGSSTTITVTHNLGTQDVVVSVRRKSDNLVMIPDTVIATTNTVTVTFSTAPTTNQYRVTVIG